MPFKESELKVLNFIFESLAVAASAEVCNLQIKIDKNRLIGMPDINDGIMDCVRFEDWEDKVAQMIQKNEISAKEWDSSYGKSLKEVKLSIWRLVLAMWLI